MGSLCLNSLRLLKTVNKQTKLTVYTQNWSLCFLFRVFISSHFFHSVCFMLSLFAVLLSSFSVLLSSLCCCLPQCVVISLSVLSSSSVCCCLPWLCCPGTVWVFFLFLSSLNFHYNIQQPFAVVQTEHVYTFHHCHCRGGQLLHISI